MMNIMSIALWGISMSIFLFLRLSSGSVPTSADWMKQNIKFRSQRLHVTEPLGFKWFYSKSSTKHPVLVQIVTFPVLVKTYHGPPKPTFLEVFMVHSLVFRWPKPLFFMVLGAHGRFILADKSSIDWSPVFGAKGSGLCGGRYRAIEAASMQEECTERWKSTCRFPWALKE